MSDGKTVATRDWVAKHTSARSLLHRGYLHFSQSILERRLEGNLLDLLGREREADPLELVRPPLRALFREPFPRHALPLLERRVLAEHVGPL